MFNKKNKKFHTPAALEFTFTEIEEPEYWLDFTEQVKENLSGFIMLMIGFEIFLLAIFAFILLLTFTIVSRLV